MSPALYSANILRDFCGVFPKQIAKLGVTNSKCLLNPSAQASLTELGRMTGPPYT
jgi:hypothetical protein